MDRGHAAAGQLDSGDTGLEFQANATRLGGGAVRFGNCAKTPAQGKRTARSPSFSCRGWRSGLCAPSSAGNRPRRGGAPVRHRGSPDRLPRSFARTENRNRGRWSCPSPLRNTAANESAASRRNGFASVSSATPARNDGGRCRARSAGFSGKCTHRPRRRIRP